MLIVSQLRQASHRLGVHVGQLACPTIQLECRRGFAKKKPGGDDEEYGKDTTTQLLLKIMEPVEVEKPPLTPEEKEEFAAYAKEYSRRKMSQHRLWQADIAAKIRLKWAAVAALPPELQEAAMEPNLEPPPLNRNMATHTPPIPDFQKLQKASRDSKGETGRRGTKR